MCPAAGVRLRSGPSLYNAFGVQISRYLLCKSFGATYLHEDFLLNCFRSFYAENFTKTPLRIQRLRSITNLFCCSSVHFLCIFVFLCLASPQGKTRIQRFRVRQGYSRNQRDNMDMSPSRTRSRNWCETASIQNAERERCAGWRL